METRIALVTGASSGIGEATAKRLTKAGFKVYGTSRRGRIDLLVNNAGFGVAPAAAEESSIDQARAIFDTNFFGIIQLTGNKEP